jgi:hypothetical protein
MTLAGRGVLFRTQSEQYLIDQVVAVLLRQGRGAKRLAASAEALRLIGEFLTERFAAPAVQR